MENRIKKTTIFSKSILEYQKELLTLIVTYCELNSPAEVGIAFKYYNTWFHEKVTDSDWYNSIRNRILAFEGDPTPTQPNQEGSSNTLLSNHELLFYCLKLSLKTYGKLSPKIVCSFADKFLEILDDDSIGYLNYQQIDQTEWKVSTSIKDDLQDITNASIAETVRKIIREE